jgi:nucleoside-triphosphatase THEP1
MISQVFKGDKMGSMNDTVEKRLIGLVGERGSGKTSVLLNLLGDCQNRPLRVAGVISPGIFEREQKIAIEMIDLVSREGRLLAVLRDEEEAGMQLGDWSFFTETLDWANQQLRAVSSCDLLILDELGPLELEFKQGLQQGLEKLDEGGFKLGIITLRPKCAPAIQRHYPEIELINLDAIGREAIKDKVFRIDINDLQK